MSAETIHIDKIPLAQGDLIIKPELESSQGQHARLLWENKFAELKDLQPSDFLLLYTGIGEAPLWGPNLPIRKFGDGSKIAPFRNLDEDYGIVPKVLFLIASPLSSDDLVNLKSVARHYKEQGVNKIVTFLTSLPHERQDHTFKNEDGEDILEVTTLKTIVNNLASVENLDLPDGGKIIYERNRPIDAAFLTQGHSLRAIEFGLREDFPILPLDVFDYLVYESGVKGIVKPYVLGPDKGRKDEARRLAVHLGNCPHSSAKKRRDRPGDGYPELELPPGVEEKIKNGGYTVVVADDEIREGGTMGELGKFGFPTVILAVKGVMARRGKISAVDHLNKKNILHIFLTDGVKPQTKIDPIKHKTTIIPIGAELEQIAYYLSEHFVEPDNPNWLQPEETHTLVRLDLTEESYR